MPTRAEQSGWAVYLLRASVRGCRSPAGAWRDYLVPVSFRFSIRFSAGFGPGLAGGGCVPRPWYSRCLLMLIAPAYVIGSGGRLHASTRGPTPCREVLRSHHRPSAAAHDRRHLRYCRDVHYGRYRRGSTGSSGGSSTQRQPGGPSSSSFRYSRPDHNDPGGNRSAITSRALSTRGAAAIVHRRGRSAGSNRPRPCPVVRSAHPARWRRLSIPLTLKLGTQSNPRWHRTRGCRRPR